MAGITGVIGTTMNAIGNKGTQILLVISSALAIAAALMGWYILHLTKQQGELETKIEILADTYTELLVKQAKERGSSERVQSNNDRVNHVVDQLLGELKNASKQDLIANDGTTDNIDRLLCESGYASEEVCREVYTSISTKRLQDSTATGEKPRAKDGVGDKPNP